MASEETPGAARRTVAVVYGTRPEAVKMAPIILALQRDPRLQVQVVVTGQHREMLDQVHATFGIEPTDDLDIHAAGQTLTQITTRSLAGLEPIFAKLAPDAVLVQGDTTTTFAAALAAFYGRIPVVHLEAGLRTLNPYSPYPEEINRRLTTQLTTLHLAPTSRSASNLLANGVASDDIVVTGNSVIDALFLTLARDIELTDPVIASLEQDPERRVILVTVHRRESWGRPLEDIGRALREIAERCPDDAIVVPIHRNPIVREAILPAVEGLSNVHVIEPLAYDQFCWAQRRSHLIITDSGGVQEEAPSLGKPVLVLRENTERPEAVDAGTVKLVGTDTEAIVGEALRLLEDDDAYAAMARAVNPYGDGEAARRSAEAILHLFEMGPRPVAFEG